MRYRVIKRAFDILFSSAVIVVGAVPGIVIALAVVADTHGSPFYLQERIGQYGRPFKIVKLRTMVADSDDLEKHLNAEQLEQWQQEHKVDDDPRITRLGAWLRKHSVDEVPNFFNVFIGQMSVIGPRAITVDELKWFGDKAAVMLSVPSGITGLWQVQGRNDATFESGMRQKLELYYAEHARARLDAQIVVKTISSIIRGTGQ